MSKSKGAVQIGAGSGLRGVVPPSCPPVGDVGPMRDFLQALTGPERAAAGGLVTSHALSVCEGCGSTITSIVDSSPSPVDGHALLGCSLFAWAGTSLGSIQGWGRSAIPIVP